MAEQILTSSDEEFAELTAWEKVKFLLNNSDYAMLMTSLTGIYYLIKFGQIWLNSPIISPDFPNLISGLTFWTKFYLIHALKVEVMTASYYVSFTLLTASIIGILTGGVITSILGGIE